MPGWAFYSGLSLPAALHRLANHHWAPENRHISSAEYDLLMEAVFVLQRIDSARELVNQAASALKGVTELQGLVNRVRATHDRTDQAAERTGDRALGP